MRDGRFVLLDATGGNAAAEAAVAAGQVQVVRCERSDLAALPAAVLIRPDCYVPWAADDGPGLANAMESAVARWCGSEPASIGGRAARGEAEPVKKPRDPRRCTTAVHGTVRRIRAPVRGVAPIVTAPDGTAP